MADAILQLSSSAIDMFNSMKEEYRRQIKEVKEKGIMAVPWEYAWVDAQTLKDTVNQLRDMAIQTENKHGLPYNTCQCFVTPIPLMAGNDEELMQELEKRYEIADSMYGRAAFIAPNGKVVNMEEWHDEITGKDLFSMFPHGTELMTGGRYIEPSLLGTEVDYLYGKGFIRAAMTDYSDALGSSEESPKISFMVHYATPKPTNEQVATMKRIVRQSKKNTKLDPDIFIDLAMVGERRSGSATLDYKTYTFDSLFNQKIDELMQNILWFNLDTATVELRENKPDNVQCACVPNWAARSY